MFKDGLNAHIRFFASPVTGKEWGDCTYIEFPDGTNMLIDCGQLNDSYSTGSAIAKELSDCGVHKIDACILTHYHSDHANGFKALFEETDIKVGTFISSPYIPKTGYQWLNYDLAINGVDKMTVAAGDTFEYGGAQFKVLWPVRENLTPVPEKNSTDAAGVYTDENPPVLGGSLDVNSKSLVIMMKYGTTKVLFTGDIYANRIAYSGAENWDYTGYDNPNSEEHLVEMYAGTDALDADIMTAPHHGKRTSSSVEFISAVSPAYAVAMGGNYQSDVKDRYTAAGAVFYLTGSTATAYKNALNKNVYVKLTGDGYLVTVGE